LHKIDTVEQLGDIFTKKFRESGWVGWELLFD
jgi:hypothetical protein